MNKLLITLLLIPLFSVAQSFAPEPGAPGSTAIHKDSSIILFWGTQVSVTRGYLDAGDPTLGLVTYGTEADAIGMADGMAVVSLGDGGIATYELGVPAIDGPGPDFAIFENGFIDHYMELAFVEVSSDGIQYVRFPAISEIPLSVQLDNFSTSDCRYVHNLAGKYRANYGTPFDLAELSDSTGIDLQAIRFIRIIDVVGSIVPSLASFDSQGTMVNDPYPTPFESGGFDLDALAVIHSQEAGLIQDDFGRVLYPNPCNDVCYLKDVISFSYKVFSMDGNQLLSGDSKQGSAISMKFLPAGIYLIGIEIDDRIDYFRVQKN